MKFENIKEGDTVYVLKEVCYGWNKTNKYTIPAKVIKTSKTQFTVENGDRYMKNGNKIGSSHGYAYKLGERWGFLEKSIVTDETDKLNNFKLKLQLEGDFNGIVNQIEIPYNSKFNVEELKELIEKIKVIYEQLN